MTALPDQLTGDGHPVARERSVREYNRLQAGGVIVPFVALIVAIVVSLSYGLDIFFIELMVALYVVSALGISIGFHRLFTHRSFECGPVLRVILLFAGSIAVQGNMLRWVAMHREHHQHSDEEGDPHSPHLGSGRFALLRGLWHSHVGWLLYHKPIDLQKFVPDLLADPLICWVDAQFRWMVAAGLLIPAIIGGIVTRSFNGALLGLLWGGLVRVFVLHHVTWSVNSVCHIWGSRPFRTSDKSVNNPIFGVLGMGEGWHNNHHAFPSSARHGLRWWEIDISYAIIRMLAAAGIVWNVKKPSQEALIRRQRAAL